MVYRLSPVPVKETLSSYESISAEAPDYEVESSLSHTLSNSLQLNHIQPPPPAAIRPSSRAWNPVDDQTLVSARAQGMNWIPIQQAYFPYKTPNACRKRHEQLMERRGSDDWDVLRLEALAKNYMGMRREIWSILAAQTGEKWHVVEVKASRPINLAFRFYEICAELISHPCSVCPKV